MHTKTARPDVLARLTTPFQARALTIFRFMLSTIFLVAGINHLLSPGAIANRLENAPMGHLATSVAPAELLVTLVGVALLLGGIALATGFKTRWAALLLILLLIPITLTVQVGSLDTMGPLAKNIGLAGGLLYFLTHGSDVTADTADR